jgi:hypothetical protein
MQGFLHPASVVRPAKAFRLMPDDVWFEVVDYLPVRDIVCLRRVSNDFPLVLFPCPVSSAALLMKIADMLIIR